MWGRLEGGGGIPCRALLPFLDLFTAFHGGSFATQHPFFSLRVEFRILFPPLFSQRETLVFGLLCYFTCATFRSFLSLAGRLTAFHFPYSTTTQVRFGSLAGRETATFRGFHFTPPLASFQVLPQPTSTETGAEEPKTIRKAFSIVSQSRYSFFHSDYPNLLVDGHFLFPLDFFPTNTSSAFLNGQMLGVFKSLGSV